MVRVSHGYAILERSVLSALLEGKKKRKQKSTFAHINSRFRIGELRSEEEIARVSFKVFYEMLGFILVRIPDFQIHYKKCLISALPSYTPSCDV